MLTASQFLLVIPTKYVYLGMILIFEIGSLLCAVVSQTELRSRTTLLNVDRLLL